MNQPDAWGDVLLWAALILPVTIADAVGRRRAARAARKARTWGAIVTRAAAATRAAGIPSTAYTARSAR